MLYMRGKFILSYTADIHTFESNKCPQIILFSFAFMTQYPFNDTFKILDTFLKDNQTKSLAISTTNTNQKLPRTGHAIQHIHFVTKFG